MRSALETAESLYKTPALVSHQVRCGKPNCRCAAGAGHGPYWFLHWREGHIQRRRYVRGADLPQVQAIIERRQAHDRDARRAAVLASDDLRRIRAWLNDLHTS